MIRKFHRRLICLFLAFLILGALLPTAGFAEESEPEEPTPGELKAQLSHMYQQVLDVTQSESLEGQCATLVTWQLYIKRINRQFVSGDGKDQYDNYCNMDVTTGGYHVHALSAEDCTLEEALLKITNNGTRNVCNILIGFEKTRTPAGALYGHTVYIGGIIDGRVYYVESNDYSVGGVYYKSGTPIECSIAEFAAEYDGWATYEGLIAFSETSYLDSCRIQPTDVYVRAQGDSEMWTEPCRSAESPWAYRERRIQTGEIFRADALVQNAAGEYWYRLFGEKDRFIPAGDTEVLRNVYTDVTVSDLKAPGIVTAGEEFTVAGNLTSAGGDLRMVRCQIFSGHAGEGKLIANAVRFMDKRSYDLQNLANRLHFRDLEPGIYHYVVSAVVENSVFDHGKAFDPSRLITLWTGEFAVCADGEAESSLRVFSLDAGDGSCAVNQVILEGEDAIPGAMPRRDGYRFAYWLREEDSLRACWTRKTETLQGWHLVDGIWAFYEDGRAVTGFLNWEGNTLYIHEDGSFHTGWLEEAGGTYYFYENGIAATGRTIIDGTVYLFDENGAECADRLAY